MNKDCCRTSVRDFRKRHLHSEEEAWDNLDPGLKQWIINGAAFAISFIPIAGPLISCIIDGTFVDMWNAIQRGDWATFALGMTNFVPGIGGAGKIGSKALGGIQKAATKGFSEVAQKKALKQLALEAGGKTYKFNKGTTAHMIEKNHLKQIADYSGSKDLRQTMGHIKQEWKSAGFDRPGNREGYQVWKSYGDHPLEFVLHPDRSTIVSIYPCG